MIPSTPCESKPAPLMPAVSFRLKLLLAMMLVVVGGTGTTFYISQQQLQESYRQRFAERLNSQIRAFLAQQALLLNNVKQMCRTVSGRRLQDALAAIAEDVNSDRLYGQVKADLITRGALALGATDTNLFHASFFVFLDAKGKIIAPPESYQEIHRLVSQPRLKKQLDLVSHAIPKMEEQISGYITPEGETGEMHLQQMVVTKVIESISGETLGALVMGFPLPEVGEKAGILFEENLYSQSLPEARRAELAGRVAAQIKTATQASESFIELIETVPHRILYQDLNSDAHFAKARLVALFSLEEYLTLQRDLRGKIIFFGGLGLIGALTLSLLLSHGLSVPIRELVTGTTEVQRGNLEIKVPVRSRDEIGRLAAAFNEMTVGLALKEKYRSVLDKVSDKAVAEELMRGNVALGGETREVSVLFCDIRGFTQLSQGMDPDEVIRMLNEHFTPLTRLVDEHDGVVDKFVGDLIMAIFGAPKSYGNDAYNAARCALAMIHQRQRLNETSQYKIEIGIGVASGSVVAGCMGSDDRLNYTVLGERVNLASRLCGKAGRMEVVIDQTTRQQLGDAASAEALPELELKGFSSRVQAYKLLEVRSLQPSV